MNVLEHVIVEGVRKMEVNSPDHAFYFQLNKETNEYLYKVNYEVFMSSVQLRISNTERMANSGYHECRVEFNKVIPTKNELIYGSIRGHHENDFSTMYITQNRDRIKYGEMTINDLSEPNENFKRTLNKQLELNIFKEEQVFQSSLLVEFDPDIAFILDKVYHSVFSSNYHPNITLTGYTRMYKELWSTEYAFL